MKKFLIALMLGFILHKVVNEIYDYSWWKHCNECHDRANDIEPYEPYGVVVRDACFKEKMGIVWYSQFILMRPMIGRDKYFVPEGWGF